MKIPLALKGFVAACSVAVMIGCSTLAAPTTQSSVVQDAESTAPRKSLVYVLIAGRLESPASTGTTPPQQVLTPFVGMGFSIEILERMGVLAGFDGSPISGDMFVSGGITYDLVPDFLRVGLRGGGSLTSPALMMSVPFIVLIDDFGLVLDLGATMSTTSDATLGGFVGIGGGLAF
jgi:hypothetical protein